jgi:hypothetical protein
VCKRRHRRDYLAATVLRSETRGANINALGNFLRVFARNAKNADKIITSAGFA